MKRPVTRLLVSGTLVAVSLVGVAACSDNTPNLTAANPSGSSTTNSVAGGSGNNSASVPLVPGASAQCQAIVQAIAGASQAMVGGSETDQAKAVFASLVDAVPAELKADAQIFADAYGAYLTALAKYAGDTAKAMADPKVLAALSDLTSAKVAAASTHLSAYMDASCGHS